MSSDEFTWVQEQLLKATGVFDKLIDLHERLLLRIEGLEQRVAAIENERPQAQD